ncbi:MAG TPA: PAS domain-containing protein, partial [Bacteroidia bacterium]|nr:PAS domain-containing protein [Bacteroidia bacterium]
MKSLPDTVRGGIYEALFNKAAEGVIAIDRQQDIRLVNPCAERLLGYSGDDLKEKKLSDIFEPAARREMMQWYENIFNDRRTDPGGRTVTTLLKKDGTGLPVEIDAYNHLLTEEGPFLIALFCDIRERRQA